MPKASERERIQSAVIRALKQRREDIGMSMNRLAESSGLSPAMISFVERELRKPTLDTLLRISEALSCDLWQVIRDASE